MTSQDTISTVHNALQDQGLFSISEATHIIQTILRAGIIFRRSLVALAEVNVTALTQKEAWDYRTELLHAICNPGTEYDEVGQEGVDDEKAYRERLAEVDAHLTTFSPQI